MKIYGGYMTKGNRKIAWERGPHQSAATARRAMQRNHPGWKIVVTTSKKS